MAGIPAALSGQIAHSIDFAPCVEASNLQISFNRPLTQKYGFAGYIGTARGQAGTQIRITFASTSAASQFNLLAKAAEQNTADLGFNYDFWEGDVGIGRHWLIPNCFLGEYSFSNEPASGNTDKSVSIMGGPPKQIQ